MARAYYNEIEPDAVLVLRQLIAEGVIAPGDVDDRSIKDVHPDDLNGYAQAHFFAGGGLWSVAARLAGWPDERPLWTGSCPCFPADVLVMTERGLIPIDQVVVGDSVLTHRARWRKVTRIGSDESDCVTVRGQGHFGLTCTPDHPFLVGHDTWAPASSIKGKRWACVSHFPPSSPPDLARQHKGFFFDSTVKAYRVKGEKDGEPVYIGVFQTPEEAAAARRTAIVGGLIDVRGAAAVDTSSLAFARFLGYWIGDGWVSGDNVVLCGAQDDGLLLSGILNSAALPASISAERTSSRARCGSKKLAAWLTTHFGAGASQKRIPAWIHGCSPEYRKAFLDGYAEADGHRETASRGGAEVRRFTSVSKALAIGVRILLNQAGVSATITRHAPNRANIIEGREVSERPFFRVTAYETARSFVFGADHGWGLVRAIAPAARQRVFNLSVDEDESYTADGIAVHNCQPFSVAGQRAGADDPRHLWPDFYRLISAGRPPVVMGEQVAGKAGRNWFNGVRSDLEGGGYAGRAVDIPACSVDAPHERNRLYWIAVADADTQRLHGRGPGEASGEARAYQGSGHQRERFRTDDRKHDDAGDVVNASRFGRGEGRAEHELRSGRTAAASAAIPSRNGSWWADAEWIECHDGKARRAQSGTPLLVDGLPGRVGLWRLAGNGISPVLAAQVIGAFLDTETFTPTSEAAA